MISKHHSPDKKRERIADALAARASKVRARRRRRTTVASHHHERESREIR